MRVVFFELKKEPTTGRGGRGMGGEGWINKEQQIGRRKGAGYRAQQQAGRGAGDGEVGGQQRVASGSGGSARNETIHPFM